MAICRGKLIFEQSGSGWIEQYFRTSTDETLGEDFSLLTALATKRAMLLGKQGKITYITTSSEQVNGDSRVGPYSTDPYLGNSTQDSDHPDVALLVRRRDTSNTGHSNMFMRGGFDSIVDKGGVFRSDVSGWLDAFNGFKSTLVSGGWGYMGKNRETSTKSLISNVVSNENGYITITTSNPVFNLGEVGTKKHVSISGVFGAKQVNGGQVVTVLSTTTCSILKPLAIFLYQGGGTINVIRQRLVTIAQLIPMRVVSRKAGSPLFHSPGRSKGR